MGFYNNYRITKEQLLFDLYKAYQDARRNKRNKKYQLEFGMKLEDNLIQLRDELFKRSYKPLPQTCFIIHDPKMREVFASDFRDRVVHHLLYNYIYDLFKRTFIFDSYSCIKGRGTHFGIKRLSHHIRSVSCGYSKPCYAMKIDIKGYFMHIDRGILLKQCRNTIDKMKRRVSDDKGVQWCQKIDFCLVDYLLDTIINTDPLEKCRILGSSSDWHNLPREKSLFCSPENCGLPIGNLTSQLFSNIYMNEFDQFIKRDLRIIHYGRYVDDAYIISDDRDFLKSIIQPIREFLKDKLGLEVNTGKLKIIDAKYGVEFLGAYIKPFRTYISNSSFKRISRKLKSKTFESKAQLRSSINSILGVFSHYNSYRLRRVLCGNHDFLNHCGQFSKDWLKYKPYGMA